MKKKVVIIGGGISGLSTAFYLHKFAKEPLDITIIEKDPSFGGRVKTVMADGSPIDLGAFMIFPFYKAFRALAKELGLGHSFNKVTATREFYQLEPSGKLIADKDLPLSSKLIPLKLATRFLLPMIEGKAGFHEPDISAFKDTNTTLLYSHYFKDSEPIQEILHDEVFQAYGYAPLRQLPPAFYAAVAEALSTHGYFNFVHTLEGGTGEIIKKLGEAVLEAQVKVVRGSANSVTGKTVSMADGSMISADVVVFATLPIVLMADLDGFKQDVTYSRFFTAVVRMKDIPSVQGENSWEVIYCRLDESLKTAQLASIAQCSCYSKLDGKHLLINLHCGSASDEAYTVEHYKEVAAAELKRFFPDDEIEEIVASQDWPQTMPIVNGRFLNEIHGRQGVGGHYFAGDYTGIPCLETAVYSGRKIAKRIVDDMIHP